jgi:hypothetical protein
VHVEDIRSLGEDAAVVDCTQVIDGGELGRLDLHLLAVVRRDEPGRGIVDCRPYAFRPLPVPAS